MNHEEATLNGKRYEDYIFPLIWAIMFPGTKLGKSNAYQNMHYHYDYWWKCYNKGKWRYYKLEVKYKYKGWGVYVLWELLNVNGDAGWGLGEADFIVFGAKDGIYVVNRAKVTAYICKKLGIQPDVRSLREAQSCLFDGAPLWKLCHRISRPNERTIKIPFEEFMTFVSPFFLSRYKENENRFRY